MKIIYVPVKNENEGVKIGKILIKENLAFCVNIVPKIKSIFKWNGKIFEENESLLIVKTNKSFDKLKKRIEELHSYEIPAILCFKISNLNKKYADWSTSIN